MCCPTIHARLWSTFPNDMVSDINVIWLDTVKSTNSYLSAVASESPHGTVVATHCQTAGRGQRGNTWEAEPGRNLTFSLLIRPNGIDASRQFYISEAVALGIVDALRRRLAVKEDVVVKWPNDIYWRDKKICGILIENSIMGRGIDHSIAGIGINVNQREFRSDAPNPVSIWQIIGEETPLEEFLMEVCGDIMARLAMPFGTLHDEYFHMLWGREGRTYRDTSTGELFKARITDVAPTGHLTLMPEYDGAVPRVYAFKEVAVML